MFVQGGAQVDECAVFFVECAEFGLKGREEPSLKRLPEDVYGLKGFVDCLSRSFHVNIITCCGATFNGKLAVGVGGVCGAQAVAVAEALWQPSEFLPCRVVYQLRWLSKLATLPLRPRFAPQSRPTVPPLPEGRRNPAVGNFLQHAGKTRIINTVTLGSARGACSWPQ